MTLSLDWATRPVSASFQPARPICLRSKLGWTLCGLLQALRPARPRVHPYKLTRTLVLCRSGIWLLSCSVRVVCRLNVVSRQLHSAIMVYGGTTLDKYREVVDTSKALIHHTFHHSINITHPNHHATHITHI